MITFESVSEMRFWECVFVAALSSQQPVMIEWRAQDGKTLQQAADNAVLIRRERGSGTFAEEQSIALSRNLTDEQRAALGALL